MWKKAEEKGGRWDEAWVFWWEQMMGCESRNDNEIEDCVVKKMKMKKYYNNKEHHAMQCR